MILECGLIKIGIRCSSRIRVSKEKLCFWFGVIRNSKDVESSDTDLVSKAN